MYLPALIPTHPNLSLIDTDTDGSGTEAEESGDIRPGEESLSLEAESVNDAKELDVEAKSLEWACLPHQILAPFVSSHVTYSPLPCTKRR